MDKQNLFLFQILIGLSKTLLLTINLILFYKNIFFLYYYHLLIIIKLFIK
jgi:hypothetical protein